MDIWIISTIFLLAIYLLVSETIPVPLTSLGMMVMLVLCRLLSPREAVAGLAHPAVVTVGAMFVVSKGMIRTGAVEVIGRQMVRLGQGNLRTALVIILGTVAFASAFINNTPIVILFIPAVMTMCCEYGLSPSKFLLPVSYASILGGSCSLIGTSTNIIISDLSLSAGYGALGMFEMAVIGVPIALMGIGLLIVAAPRLMPSSLNPICQIQDGNHRRYMAELKIPRGSRLIGADPMAMFAATYPDVDILEVIRYSHIYQPARDEVTISADDLLLIKGSLNDLVAILHHEDVQLPQSEKGLSFGVGKEEPIVLELIISPNSGFLGQRLLETDLMRDPDIHVIAIKRTNLHFTERQLHDIRLKVGDILLVWCYSRKLAAMRVESEYILIEDVYEEIVHKRKAWLALSIFIGMIAAATLGVADIMICALTAAFLFIVTGCLQMRDAYKSLQGDVLLLIVGTIALGAAMNKSGASDLYAHSFLNWFTGQSPRFILGGIILITSLGTQILSNNAIAVLIFPIAVSTALGLGVDPKPFIMGVCFGASACFASPMGYQTNLLVYGPGGYRFSDYLKLGIPLNLLVLVVGTVFIPLVWRF